MSQKCLGMGTGSVARAEQAARCEQDLHGAIKEWNPKAVPRTGMSPSAPANLYKEISSALSKRPVVLSEQTMMRLADHELQMFSRTWENLTEQHLRTVKAEGIQAQHPRRSPWHTNPLCSPLCQLPPPGKVNYMTHLGMLMGIFDAIVLI